METSADAAALCNSIIIIAGFSCTINRAKLLLPLPLLKANKYNVIKIPRFALFK
jgi:hypothetical protein